MSSLRSQSADMLLVQDDQWCQATVHIDVHNTNYQHHIHVNNGLFISLLASTMFIGWQKGHQQPLTLNVLFCSGTLKSCDKIAGVAFGLRPMSHLQGHLWSHLAHTQTSPTDHHFSKNSHLQPTTNQPWSYKDSRTGTMHCWLSHSTRLC